MIAAMMKRGKKLIRNRRGEFGISAILGIAMALTITAFVVFPGIRGLSQSVMDELDDWWTGTVAQEIFSSAAPSDY